MRPRTLLVGPAQAGRSVKSLLKSDMEMSKTYISRLKRREGGILLNGEPAYTTARVRAGDVLSALTGDPPGVFRPVPMRIPLSIAYEDEYLIVLDKPAGLSVHASTKNPGEPTLENALAAYLPEDCGMHPVSRLDRGTTGLMTVAKSGYVHELFKRRQHGEGFVKTYLAVACRAPVPPAGLIDAPLRYAPGSRYKMAAGADGAPSRTRYETLKTAADGAALVRIVPETGRTHQIRVHMAHIGCALVGDWLYGAEDARIPRPALHAAELAFTHPLTGERLALSSPLPEDMRGLVFNGDTD